jgi:FkbM family methyltransferase
MDKTLIALSKRIGLTALDVGARGGVNTDLKGIASEVSYVGFEPDQKECNRLNKLPNLGGWGASRFLPVALAAEPGIFSLNLYSQPGCTSKYQARKELGALFARGHYYDINSVVQVPCQRLDDLVSMEAIEEPAYMKIDVQGMEDEVFQGAEMTLRNHLCAIRAEVSFFPIYKDQPLFAEIDQRLRSNGFVPMRWLESHEWRRSTSRKPRKLSNNDIPYSRGQLIHADVLYLLHPETLPSNTPEAIRRLLRLGVLAACYEHYDHALAAFTIQAVRQYAHSELKLDLEAAVKRMSQAQASFARRLAYRAMRVLENNFA